MSRSPMSTRLLSQMAAARKITFCNCRTLPGQRLPSKRRVSAGGQAADRALDLRAGLLHEVARQQQDVLAALAQGRHFDIEDVEAVEQVFAKGALG